jgi:hypothetical protein
MADRRLAQNTPADQGRAADQEDASRLENDGAPAKLSREEAAEMTRKGAEKEGKDAPFSPERDVTTATHEDPGKTPPQGSDNQREDLEKLKHPLQAEREAVEEKVNREQATSSETPAGDPSPHPQASETANLVDQPGRAHTLYYDEDEGRAVSLGERLRKAQETEQLEIRPKTHPGISTDDPRKGYDVNLELRAQWPGISLGDDVEPEEASAAEAE